MRVGARSHDFVVAIGFAHPPSSSPRDPKSIPRPRNAELSPLWQIGPIRPHACLVGVDLLCRSSSPSHSMPCVALGSVSTAGLVGECFLAVGAARSECAHANSNATKTTKAPRSHELQAHTSSSSSASSLPPSDIRLSAVIQCNLLRAPASALIIAASTAIAVAAASAALCNWTYPYYLPPPCCSLIAVLIP